MSWKNIKGSGPWNFTKQGDKKGYANNPFWKPQSFATPNHSPCGYWLQCPEITYEYTKGTKWELKAPEINPVTQMSPLIEYNGRLYTVGDGTLRVWNEADIWEDVTDALPPINVGHPYSITACNGRIYYTGWGQDGKRYVASWGEGETEWTYQVVTLSTGWAYRMALVCWEDRPYLITTWNGFEVYNINQVRLAGTLDVEVRASTYISGIDDFNGHLLMYIHDRTKNSLFKWSGGIRVELWEEAELINESAGYITPQQLIRSYDGCIYSYETTVRGWPIYSQLRKWNGSGFERVGNIQVGYPMPSSGHMHQLANYGNKLFMITGEHYANALYCCDYDFNWMLDTPERLESGMYYLVEHGGYLFAVRGQRLYRSDTRIRCINTTILKVNNAVWPM